MKTAPSVEPEPIYEFVKGKGWVITNRTTYSYNEVIALNMSFDTICINCNDRLGVHWGGLTLYCRGGGRASYFSPIR